MSDSVTNFQTVASFGYENLIVDKYTRNLSIPFKSGLKKAHISGFVYGFSQFVQYATYGTLFWSASALLRAQYNRGEMVNPKDIFTAIFAILFGAFTAGQAQ